MHPLALGLAGCPLAGLTASVNATLYLLVTSPPPDAWNEISILLLLLAAALFLPFAKALPFLAVGVLILAASTALGGTWIPSRPRPLALTAAGLYVTVEGIYILQALSPLDRLADCLAASALLGASVWLFFPLLRGGEGREVVDGLVFLAGALVTAVGGLGVLGFSPPRALVLGLFHILGCRRAFRCLLGVLCVACHVL